jgi:hypothetical protein
VDTMLDYLNNFGDDISIEFKTRYIWNL